MKQPRNIAIIALCLYAFAIAVSANTEGNGIFDFAANSALGLIVCAWVLADAQQRQRQLWYDYDTVLFFLWPVVAPIYLFQTRGLRGLIPLFLFILILTASYTAGFVLH